MLARVLLTQGADSLYHHNLDRLERSAFTQENSILFQLVFTHLQMGKDAGLKPRHHAFLFTRNTGYVNRKSCPGMRRDSHLNCNYFLEKVSVGAQ